MSSTLEDRLTAALAARADLIQPEGLRPAAPPAPPRLRRSTALLAAASVVIAGTIAAVWLTNDNGEPEPAKPMPDGYAEIGRARGDIDGDGRDDLVRLGRMGSEKTGSSTLLVADLAIDRRTTVKLGAGQVPELVGLTRLDQLPGQAIVASRPGAGKDFTLLVFGVVGDRLQRLPEGPAQDNDEGLRQSGDVRIGYALEPRLTVWRYVPLGPEEQQVVDIVTWSVDQGRLRGERVAGRRCWHQGERLPTRCPDVRDAPSGFVDGTRISVDLDGDGTDDEVRVSKPKVEASAPPVIIATLSSGAKTGTMLSNQTRPGSLRAIKLESANGPVTAVVVETDFPGGHPRYVYTLVGGALVEAVVAPQDPANPYGLREGERWGESGMDGSTLLSWNARLSGRQGNDEEVVVYRYRIDGERLIPVKLGVRCVDPVEVELPHPC